jgi:hypothetical protein
MRPVTLLLLLACLAGPARASDHADIPTGEGVPRPDLNWTDLHVFTVGKDLVLAGSIDANVKPDVTNYIFATDAELRFIIDNQGDIFEEVVFSVSFTTVTDETGTHSVPTVTAFGYEGVAQQVNPASVRVFAGLRDDPFIRRPRQLPGAERNVAAVVLQMPLAGVLAPGSTEVRVWGTTVLDGAQIELNGRALRSMSEPLLNTQHPSQHAFEADVVTFDTSRRAKFPNGRALTDDVVDRVPQYGLRGADVRNSEGCGTVGIDYENCVKDNNQPFLTEFPYLAPPN